MNNKQPEISVIIPFLNEKNNIPFLISELDNFFSKYSPLSEVIFVDDGSTDNSANVLIKECQNISFTAKLIKLSKNYGSDAALRAGINNASGKFIVSLYSDLQDTPYLIEKLYNKINTGFDIIWAFRESIGISLSTKIFSKLIRRFAIADYPKSGSDIVMFNNKVKNVLNVNLESNSSLFLQILCLGFKQGNISYKRGQRKHGKSKWTLSNKIKAFIDSFIAFSYMPIRLVSIIGILFAFLGFLWTIYIIIRTLIFKDLSAGWPALVSILLIGFGITNISLGIIAEYLWRTLDAARNRPIFIIDKIIELNSEKE